MTSGLRLTMFLQASIVKAGLTNHKFNITPIIGVASHILHSTKCPISFLGHYLGQVKKIIKFRYKMMKIHYYKITAFAVLKSYYGKVRYGMTSKAAAYATVCCEISENDLMAVYRGSLPEFLADDAILPFTDPALVAKKWGVSSTDSISDIRKQAGRYLL